MHILFGKEQAQELSNKYTVLELDTFKMGTGGPDIVAFCAVENIPFDELADLDQARAMHDHLLINYRLRNWQDCLQGIESLKGLWGKELDTFYADLENRIKSFIKNPPPADWTPIIQK